MLRPELHILGPDKPFEDWAMSNVISHDYLTTFDIKKCSANTAKTSQVPQLRLGCGLNNTLPWPLASRNTSKSTKKKKKLKHYELNTKSREMKLRPKKAQT